MQLGASKKKHIAGLQRPRNSSHRAVARLVHTLASVGVKAVFGLPGSTIAPLFDALMDTPDIRSVTVHHENHALFAAAGYARMSGRIGVASVTSGPGVLNAVTGIASAYCDSTPLLLLVGDVARSLHGKNALQDGHALQLETILRSVTKWTQEVPDSNALVPMARRAIQEALAGRPGPVALIVPMDIFLRDTRITEIAVAASIPESVSESTVARVTRVVESSRSGVILAGSGVRAGNGPASLYQLAERLDWPVMTTPKGKGVFPENHAQSLGVFGMGGHPSAYEFLATGVDTLLVLGSSLNDLATDAWCDLLIPRSCMIHVDVDLARIGRNYAVDIAIGAPVAPFMCALCQHLSPRDAYPPTRLPRLVRYSDPRELSNGPEGRIDPARAIWEIQQCLPADTVFSIDSGDHFAFAAHYLTIVHYDSFLSMIGLGSMASSISAMGAKIAMPERTVAIICGDGGFAMMAAELATLVRESISVAVFVFNDQRLGMVERGNQRIYGRTPDYSTAPIDIFHLARSMGARAFVAKQANDILSLRSELSPSRDPLVVDVHIDRLVAMPANSRFEMLARINGLDGESPE